MSLDDKLIKILNGLGAPYGIQDSSRIVEHAQKVKDLFAAEGYVTPEDAKKVQTMVNQMAQLAQDNFHMPTSIHVALDKKQQKMKGLMTGQEFYDRFERELKVHPMMEGQYDVYAIAKRAAGLT